MEKNKYIYGASIQGIQGFIFSTNSLKDVVGGSELVEKVCTTLFESTYEQGGGRQSSKQPVTSNVSMTTFRNVRKPSWSFQKQ